MNCKPVEIRLPHLALAGIECGEGPLAILLHGLAAGAHVFEPLMERLAVRFRCVSLDQRGHGSSGRPADGYTGADFAHDLALAVSALHGGRALLIGTCLGARNALVAAARAAHQLRAVVAIEYAPFLEPDALESLEAAAEASGKVHATLAAARESLEARHPDLPPDALERRLKHGFAAARGGVRARVDAPAMRRIAAGMRADTSALVDEIDLPVLVARGMRSPFISAHAWARMQSLRPDFGVCELADAGHFPAEEAPRAVADIIHDFWNGLDAHRRA